MSKQLQNIQYARWWWWWWRDMRKTKMKLMLVSFPSPKCNHNKLPLWGTDTFDLYFFMIHVCIYCCAVAHMDNPVPHVWISLNSKDALTAVLSDFLKLLLSVCTVFVSLAFFDTRGSIHIHGRTDRQTLPQESWELLRRGHFHDWQCSVAAGIGWPSSGPSPSLFWLLSWILLLCKNNYTKPVEALPSLFFSF